MWGAAGYVLTAILNHDWHMYHVFEGGGDPNDVGLLELPVENIHDPNYVGPSGLTYITINGVDISVIDGVGYLTKQQLFDIMCYSFKHDLVLYSRGAPYEVVKAMMENFDTDIHDLTLGEMRFKFEGDLFIEAGIYTGEQINYVAVGMGFAHFDYFSCYRGGVNSGANAALRHGGVRWWNTVHFDFFIEHEQAFCDYGASMYQDVRNHFARQKYEARLKEQQKK